eukprot:6208428-Pleurochrysis_carterae.AAC.1
MHVIASSGIIMRQELHRRISSLAYMNLPDAQRHASCNGQRDQHHTASINNCQYGHDHEGGGSSLGTRMHRGDCHDRIWQSVKTLQYSVDGYRDVVIILYYSYL